MNTAHSSRIRLPRPPGGHIDVYGDPEAQRIVLIVGRNDFLQDDDLVEQLILFLRDRGVTVGRYESRSAETRRLTTPPFARSWPRRWQLPARALLLIVFPTRWRSLSPRYRARTGAIPAQVDALRQALSALEGKQVFLLGRSAGARISTLLADECGVAGVAALGYPFENPKEGPNPDRYRHLETLRTPLIIFQGTRDTYGGIEASSRYPLSPTTTLEFVDTDHSMQMSDDAWAALRERLADFLGLRSNAGADTA